MLRHSWPGNVRELKNAIERMAITAQSGVAGPFVLDDDVYAGARLLSLPATAGKLRDEMEQTERAVIDAALREHHGEINATCRALGISRRALYERMKKYGLVKESYK
jgi:DNA-binding NtrC family response regulator